MEMNHRTFYKAFNGYILNSAYLEKQIDKASK